MKSNGKSAPFPDKPAKILVRATNWIGDGVMMTPALKAIRERFPAAEIVVVANPLVAQLFLPHPDCDRVIVYDRKGVHRGGAGFFRFVQTLRAERFDLAILLQKAIEAALLAKLAGIPHRIGFSTDMRGALLTAKTALTPEIRKQHHSQHYLLMLAAFGIVSRPGLELSLKVTEEERCRAAALLGEGKWVAINPGAAYGSAKRWYPERFAEVADGLANEHGFKVVVIGGPGEQEIGKDIVNGMNAEALNLVGKTSVREMMAILGHCSLVITNDSGPMHVAAALQVPIVAIFGPTDHTTTFPWTKNYRVVRSNVDCAPCLERTCPLDHRCMLQVSSDQVLAAASELI